MAKHTPPPDDFVPWFDRLSNWWANRRLQREFAREIDSTNGFEMFRTFYAYGPKEDDQEDPDDV